MPPSSSSSGLSQMRGNRQISGKSVALSRSTTVALGHPWRDITPQFMRRLPGGAFFFISEGCVVNFDGDAVVNATNIRCLGGGGVDGAINKAGGEILRASRRALPVVKILDNGAEIRCPTGEAKVTKGGNLKATWCIHACGPTYRTGDARKKDKLLARAYKQSMLRAKEKGIKTVAFSLLSAGIFLGSRKLEDVLSIAVQSICEGESDGLEEVHLVGFNSKEVNSLLKVAREYFENKASVARTKQETCHTTIPVGNASKHLRDLLRKQCKQCPRIKTELKNNGKKTSHWAWWVFPTDKPGFSEPMPETFVMHKERQLFLELSKDTGWKDCLELVATLVSEKGSLGKVLPQIDHGRVEFFCLFWCDNFQPPPWLKRVIEVLKGKPTFNPFDEENRSGSGTDSDISCGGEIPDLK